jgi:O-antigen/teichoic acid export membrane protein
MQAILQIIKSKSFSSLIGNGLGALLGVITFAVLARVLPKDIFGPYIIFLAIYGIFENLRIGMVMNALVRNLSQCKNSSEEEGVIGSTLFITVSLTFLYGVVMLLLYFIFKQLNVFSEYLFFFKWWIGLAFLSLPNNYATWYLNAKLKIKSMSIIRILGQIVFIIYIYLVVVEDTSIYSVLNGYLLSQLVISLLALLMGWSGFNYFFRYTRSVVIDIFHFGKFSMGTLLGSNLLRSSDTFIIGLSSLGKEGVAKFNVPARLLEIVEMPLRSFAVTALPQFARQYAEGNFEALRYEFERKAGMVFYLLLPISLISFIFADYIVLLIGGKGYADAALTLRLFASYMAILPLDKFSGVMLDTINKPNLNFYKILIMLFVNISGDFIGIALFGNVESVAVVSTATFLAGMIYGYIQLKKHMGVSFRNLLVLGWIDYKGYIFRILKIRKVETKY